MNFTVSRLKQIMAAWWPAIFLFFYLSIVGAGVVWARPNVSYIDTCEDIVGNCSLLDKNIDKTQANGDIKAIDSKPMLGSYRSFTYDTTTWGNVTQDFEEFKKLADETLHDPRGWSQAGLSFTRVDSGGDFTLVLSEASELDKIAGCSSSWSCRSGRYVIINQDRWAGATTAWDSYGGSLRNYRHMVINHETGHWLGLGHQHCSGPGNLAYVMQQQSIDLEGCKPNPWPLLVEIEMLP